MRRFLVALLAFVLLSGSVSRANAQRPTTARKKKAPPEPRKVELRTKDGVDLSGVYFGSNAGKQAIPVLLVHGWKGAKAPYGDLCLGLRAAGCAVFALDYRGHGGSREYIDPSGKKKSFNQKTMGKRDIGNIVAYDFEEVKQFLKKENNEGNLNLNALVLIAVRDGAIPAIAWAKRDWQFPSVGSRKQGQDVKALVLVSPKRSLKGIAVEPMLEDPLLAALPTMFVIGKGSPEQSDGNRIYKRVGVMKRRFSGGEDAKGLTLYEPKQPLGGPVLINNKPSNVIPEIAKFIKAEVVISDVDNPWIERE